MGEWDRSKERKKAWKHAAVKEEECSQRCSQGCWVGRRQWAKLRGWQLEGSCAWPDDSNGVDRRTLTHTGVSMPRLLIQHTLNCRAPLSAFPVHLDTQGDPHYEMQKMQASVRMQTTSVCVQLQHQLLLLFSFTCLFSPLFLFFLCQPWWILIQLWADWIVSAGGLWDQLQR